jgi:diguanylate cyclase (GGDEF)-like protein
VGVLSLYSTATQAFSDEHRRNAESLARQLGGLLRDTQARGRTAPALELVTPRLVLRSHASSETQSPNSAAVLLVEFSNAVGADSEEAGAVLEHTASLIQRSIRAGDVVLRYGPKQLLVILPQTDGTTARAIAEDRLGPDSSNHVTAGEGIPPSHAQIGVAFVPRDGVLLESVVVAARRRLQTGEPGQDDSVSGHVH